MSRVVAIIDYGLGNIHSVVKAIEACSGRDQSVVLASTPNEAKGADHIIVPGVGAMRDCMAGLRQQGFIEPLNHWRLEKPVLGICMGMQVMMAISAEGGDEPGLGWFDFKVERLETGGLKVPHMGWNQVAQKQPHEIWHGIADNAWFYHVHSYCVSNTSALESIGVCEYGQPFSTVVARDYVVGVQFHPEKSAESGLRLLKNFLAWSP